MARDEAGVEVRLSKRFMSNHALQKSNVGGYADHLVVRERASEPAQGRCAVFAPHDQLGDHRVVILADLVAGANTGVDAYFARLGRRTQMRDAPDRRQEPPVRVFGVDARFKRVAAYRQLRLSLGQRFACRHAQLPFDQIEPGDHLGDWMLHLQPCVHLHEVKRSVLIGDELNGTRANIADRLGCRDRGCAHLRTTLLHHARRWRFFEHLLMPALHRAVALEQVDALAMRVGKHLKFDVARLGEILLEQHGVITEARFGLPPRRSQGGSELPASIDDAHAFAAAAGSGFDEHRIANAGGFAGE